MAAPWGIAPKAWRFPIFFPDYENGDFSAALCAAWKPETRMCQYLLGSCQQPCAIREYATSAVEWMQKEQESSDTDSSDLSLDQPDIEPVEWQPIQTTGHATITCTPFEKISELDIKDIFVDETVYEHQTELRKIIKSTQAAVAATIKEGDGVAATVDADDADDDGDDDDDDDDGDDDDDDDDDDD